MTPRSAFPAGRAAVLAAIIGLIGIIGALLPSGFNFEEDVGLTVLFQMRGPRSAPPDVVVVALDEDSAGRLDLPDDFQDWPHEYYAEAVRRLAREGASVIAFDIFFREGRYQDNDLVLSQAFRQAGNVVLVSSLKMSVTALPDGASTSGARMIVESMVSPSPVLAQEAAYFAPFPLPKTPRNVVQYWAFKQTADVPTLPVAVLQVHALRTFSALQGLLRHALADPRVQAATDAANVNAREEARWIIGADRTELRGVEAMNRLVRGMRVIMSGRTLIADHLNVLLRQRHQDPDPGLDLLKSLLAAYQGDATRYFNLYGPARTVTTIPFYKLLERPSAADGGVEVRGKAVFIGASPIHGYNLGDQFRTPFTTEGGVAISGVELAATAFANLLERRPVEAIGTGYKLLIIALAGVVFSLICTAFRPPLALAVLAAVGTGYFIAALWQFGTAGLWFPIAIPLFIQAPGTFGAAMIWRFADARRLEIEHRELQQLDEAKSAFISLVSHEFKTPLTSIRGFADNMLSGVAGELGDTQLEYLHRIVANTQRLSRMIADVLDVSRIEAGIQQVDLVPMHLCNVVRECVAQLAPAAAAKRLTMEAICRDPDVVVRIDHDKFTQIITNLLDNAVKFTPRDGSVMVAAGRDEAGRAYVTVTDTGEGIPPESLDRLFQRFYQAGQKLSARKQGLGLGLYLVKSLIELQHGTISVTSELGKGSEFRITLPIHAQGPASPGTGDGRLE